MKEIQVQPEFKSLVASIYHIQNTDPLKETKMPIFADGYPGIVFSKSDNPFILLPQKKELSTFYLYGQTIEPILLATQGSFDMFIFKLYPFAVRYLLQISPGELNNDCFDLTKMIQKSPSSIKPETVIEYVYNFINFLLKNSAKDPNSSILMAISMIVEHKGNISMEGVQRRLFLNNRTFERNFKRETGIRPKQFADIVRFNFSIGKISDDTQSSLTDIGYESGYTDQSHFIRNFKRFVGTTPREFQNQMKKTLYPTLKTGRKNL